VARIGLETFNIAYDTSLYATGIPWEGLLAHHAAGRGERQDTPLRQSQAVFPPIPFPWLEAGEDYYIA
jgi:hypothetical protein